MPSYTTNYNLNKPLVNDPTDQDLWGGYLNDNMDTIDAALESVKMPTGCIVLFPVNSAPTGFLELNGALVSRTTYADLWTFANASGNIVTDANWSSNSSYGAFSEGNGTTTFRLPDYRGLFVRGWDNTRGIDTGRTIGSYQDDSFESHTHTATVTDPGHIHAESLIRAGSGVLGQGNSRTDGTSDANTASAVTGISVSNSSTGGTETTPKNISAMYCIKT